MYKVFDNEKPADKTSYAMYNGCGWDDSEYATFEEALAYTEKWLGMYRFAIPKKWDGSPIDYSGCGDFIEIRKINHEV